MANEVQLYNAQTAIVEAQADDYVLKATLGGVDALLKRDVDFGVIPRTKQPFVV